MWQLSGLEGVPGQLQARAGRAAVWRGQPSSAFASLWVSGTPESWRDGRERRGNFLGSGETGRTREAARGPKSGRHRTDE